MKLLFCEYCGDIFNLSRTLKECSCGLVKGKYDDDLYARVNGNGKSLAIGNGSFKNALWGKAQFEYARRDGMPLSTFLAWARPHEGPMNPHTIIDEDL